MSFRLDLFLRLQPDGLCGGLSDRQQRILDLLAAQGPLGLLRCSLAIAAGASHAARNICTVDCPSAEWLKCMAGASLRALPLHSAHSAIEQVFETGQGICPQLPEHLRRTNTSGGLGSWTGLGSAPLGSARLLGCSEPPVLAAPPRPRPRGMGRSSSAGPCCAASVFGAACYHIKPKTAGACLRSFLGGLKGLSFGLTLTAGFGMLSCRTNP